MSKGEHDEQHGRKPEDVVGAEHARLHVDQAIELRQCLLGREARGLQLLQRRDRLRIVRRDMLDQVRAMQVGAVIP